MTFRENLPAEKLLEEMERIEKRIAAGETIGKYVLDAEGNPVEERSLIRWAEWMENSDRCVALDVIFPVDLRNRPLLEVSTVFLGLDHCWMPGGTPLLWETMIFGAEEAGVPSKWHQFRYHTRQEAERYHRHLVSVLHRWTRMKASMEDRQ